MGTWIGLALLAAASIALTAVVGWLVMFGQSSTCGEVPDPDEVRTGRIVLLGLLLLVAGPWSVGAVMTRRRSVVVAGVVAVTPAVLLFLNGLGTDAWVGSFCF